MKKKLVFLLLFVLTVTTVFAQQLTDGFETWPSANWNLIETSSSNSISQSSSQKHSGTKSLRFSSYNSASSYDQYIVSNEISWTELENEFSFWHRGHSSYGDEVIYVGWSATGNDVDTDFTWSTIIEPTLSWGQYSKIDLPANTKYIAIHYNPGSSEYYCYIDDVVLGNVLAGAPDAPTLVSPAHNAVNVALDATLNWTINTENTVSSVLHVADNVGFTSETIVPNATSGYEPILSNGTTYYWKVVAVGATSIETSSEIRSFTTVFGAITVFPYTEGFEGTWSGTPAAPLGWAQISVSGPNPWVSYSSSPHLGSKCARAPYAGPGGNHLLITPTFNFEASTDYRLKFWLRGSTSAGTDLKVQIAGNYTDAASFTAELANYVAGTNMPTSWTEQTISLAGYTGNQAIAFRLIDDDGYSLYIDDITIEEIPSTPIVELNTAPIAFGTVVVGEFSSEIVSIKNIGGGTLNIADIEIIGTDANQFRYEDSEDYTLTATEELLIEVFFTPTSNGAKTATLKITDDFGDAPYEIALTGTGLNTNIEEINIPYTQGFETAEGLLGWTSNFNSTNTYVTAKRNTGNTHTGTYSYQVYNSGDVTATAELISPLVVPDMDAYRVRFWAKKSSTGNTQPLVVGKYNQAMNSFTPCSTIALTTSYAEYTVNMDAHAKANERIAFQFSFTGTYQYVYVDDILFEVIPSAPIATLSVSELNFNTVNVGETSIKSVSISNTGAGTLNIRDIDIDGANSRDFAFSTVAEGPWALTTGQSLAITVNFTPSEAGTLNATLSITDDLGSKVSIAPASKTNKNNRNQNTVTLTGIGFIPPQGSICSNPLPLSFPTGDVTGNTLGFGDDYDNAWVTPSSNYLGGDDVVYQFTFANSMLLNGTITSPTTYIGAFILQEEPRPTNPPTVFLLNTSTSTALNYTNELIPAGTYYLIISNWISPQNIAYTINLTATPLPAPDAVTYTAPTDASTNRPVSGNLTWSSAVGAEGYRVYLSTDNTFTDLTPVDQTTTTYAYSGLEYSTTYYWKVIPYNSVGSPTEGIAVWSFTTIPDPTIPMPISLNFEGTTTVPATITLNNMTVAANAHGNIGNVLYKNVWSATSGAYAQFQAMNNITAGSVVSFDYRVVGYYSPYAAWTLVAGYDYFVAKVSTDNGATFTTIDQINSTNHTNSNVMASRTIDISEYAGLSVIFRFEMNWPLVGDYFFELDNIFFGEPPTELVIPSGGIGVKYDFHQHITSI